jgi:hypothetical protein
LISAAKAHTPKDKLEATITASIGFRIANLQFIPFPFPTNMRREWVSAVDNHSLDQFIGFHIARQLSVATGSTV